MMAVAVWRRAESVGIGKNQVCLPTLKSLDGVAPFLQDELAGITQLFHDGLHHVNIRTGRFSMVILVLVRRFVPVTGNDDGVFLVVNSLLCECGQTAEECHDQMNI